MINVKQASKIALENFHEIFESQNLSMILLEEIELSEDQKHWQVIVGYEEKPVGSLGLDMVHRKYKLVKIEADTGTLLSIKHYVMKA